MSPNPRKLRWITEDSHHSPYPLLGPVIATDLIGEGDGTWKAWSGAGRFTAGSQEFIVGFLGFATGPKAGNIFLKENTIVTIN